MATHLQNLITSRDNLAAELATQSARTNKPSYSAAGRSVSWSAYRAELVAGIRDLNEQIILAQGAVEIQTIAQA